MAPGIGDFFKGLLGSGEGGGGEPAAGAPVAYQGYVITATLRTQGGQWMTCGTVTKEIDGVLREHAFIRAETHASPDAAESFAVTKGKQIIDEFGDRMFEKG